MNKSRYPFLYTCWLALALALWPVLRAQETPPAPPPAEAAPSVAPTAPAEPAVAPEDKAVDEAEKAVESKPEADEKLAPAEKKDADELRDLTSDENKPSSSTRKRTTRSRNRHNDAPPFGNHVVAQGVTQGEAVSVWGDTRVDGTVTGEAVSVFGSTTVNGTVGDQAVSVFGSTTINGHVKGQAVTVFGDLILGPEAKVDGETVVVFGKIIRAPGAQLNGSIQEVGSFGPFGDFTGLRTWLTKCLFMGRLLAFDSRVLWAWYVAFGFLAFYVLVALIAPQGVQKCVETLEQKPGPSLLAALLTMVLTPIAFLLLLLTVVLAIGAVLIPAFSLGLFCAALFGKIVILCWLGRRLVRVAGDGPFAHPAVCVALGGVVMLLFYTIPVAGFVIHKLAGILGLGVVIYTLLLQYKASRPAKPVPVAMPKVSPDVPGVTSVPVPEAATPPVLLPSVISAATLPRVGFWHRLGASVLDAILMGMVCGFLSNMWHGFGVFPFWFAVYCVTMWATKGTTIGGIICGLKVVRVDDRPIDWSVAIVRGLAGFLSLFVAGLGFIWVAFDDDKQSWHDKIAGTTIVRVPKGVSLI